MITMSIGAFVVGLYGAFMTGFFLFGLCKASAKPSPEVTNKKKKKKTKSKGG